MNTTLNLKDRNVSTLAKTNQYLVYLQAQLSIITPHQPQQSLINLHLSLCLTLCFFSHHLCEMWCGKKCVCEESQMRYFTNHLLKHYHDDTCCRLSDCYSNTFIQESLTLGVIANQQQTPDTSTQLPHASVELQWILRSDSPHDNREGHRRLNSNLKASADVWLPYHTERGNTSSVSHTSRREIRNKYSTTLNKVCLLKFNRID